MYKAGQDSMKAAGGTLSDTIFFSMFVALCGLHFHYNRKARSELKSIDRDSATDGPKLIYNSMCTAIPR